MNAFIVQSNSKTHTEVTASSSTVNSLYTSRMSFKKLLLHKNRRTSLVKDQMKPFMSFKIVPDILPSIPRILLDVNQNIIEFEITFDFYINNFW